MSLRVEAAAAGIRVSVPIVPSRWRIAWWLNRLSPALGLYVGRKALERLRRDLEAARPDREA